MNLGPAIDDQRIQAQVGKLDTGADRLGSIGRTARCRSALIMCGSDPSRDREGAFPDYTSPYLRMRVLSQAGPEISQSFWSCGGFARRFRLPGRNLTSIPMPRISDTRPNRTQ